MIEDAIGTEGLQEVEKQTDNETQNWQVERKEGQ